jgi:hypothetical protein
MSQNSLGIIGGSCNINEINTRYIMSNKKDKIKMSIYVCSAIFSVVGTVT